MYSVWIRDIVSGLAVVTTIFQFLSGIPVCKQYVVRQTTGEATPLPFICGVVSTALWLFYGLTKNDYLIVLVNTVGIVLMVVYTAVFYLYTFRKSALLKQIVVIILILLFVIGYVYTEEDIELLLNRLGSLACFLTLLTVAAPMSKLLYVIKVKNTECLPFPMILMSFFVSTLWLLYGLIEEDVFLVLPNFLGAGLALSQLSLFLVYPSTIQPAVSSKSLIA